MTAAVTIRLDGFDALDRRLRQLPGKIERACLRKALRSSATKIARRLKPATPRVSGAAQRAVNVRVRVRHGGAYARIGYRQRPGFYIRLREHGSRRQSPRPFFQQAVSGWEPEVQREFRDALRGAVEKAEGLT